MKVILINFCPFLRLLNFRSPHAVDRLQLQTAPDAAPPRAVRPLTPTSEDLKMLDKEVLLYWSNNSASLATAATGPATAAATTTMATAATQQQQQWQKQQQQ